MVNVELIVEFYRRAIDSITKTVVVGSQLDHPKARCEQLIVRDLDLETIVYDTRTHKALCLTDFARQIWQMCDGTRDAKNMAEAQDGISVELVSRTLTELSKANLLESPYNAAAHTSRRKVIGKMAGSGWFCCCGGGYECSNSRTGGISVAWRG